MEKINAFSIDLEDWYPSELVGGRKSPSSQATKATQPILDLLDRYQTKASFFVVGEVAEQNPDLIRSIYERGHEIGCHTFSHKLVWNLDESLFRGELERFHSTMEKILGKVKMKGFRAPCFSIDNPNKWALKLPSDFVYQYDASIFPVKINPLYGVRGAPNRPYRISFEDVRREDPQSPLIEFPMCPLRIGRLKIPIAGGFYLRMFPLPFLFWGLRRMNQTQPFILYIHPWESYEKTPRFNCPFTIASFILRYQLSHDKTEISREALPVYESGSCSRTRIEDEFRVRDFFVTQRVPIGRGVVSAGANRE